MCLDLGAAQFHCTSRVVGGEYLLQAEEQAEFVRLSREYERLPREWPRGSQGAHFGSQRQSGARHLRGLKPQFYTLRDLQHDVFS